MVQGRSKTTSRPWWAGPNLNHSLFLFWWAGSGPPLVYLDRSWLTCGHGIALLVAQIWQTRAYSPGAIIPRGMWARWTCLVSARSGPEHSCYLAGSRSGACSHTHTDRCTESNSAWEILALHLQQHVIAQKADWHARQSHYDDTRGNAIAERISCLL